MPEDLTLTCNLRCNVLIFGIAIAGAGIGFYTSGPIGGVVGFALGGFLGLGATLIYNCSNKYCFDEEESAVPSYQKGKPAQNQYYTCNGVPVDDFSAWSSHGFPTSPTTDSPYLNEDQEYGVSPQNPQFAGNEAPKELPSPQELSPVDFKREQSTGSSDDSFSGAVSNYSSGNDDSSLDTVSTCSGKNIEYQALKHQQKKRSESLLGSNKSSPQSTMPEKKPSESPSLGSNKSSPQSTMLEKKPSESPSLRSDESSPQSIIRRLIACFSCFSCFPCFRNKEEQEEPLLGWKSPINRE